jgi:tRNA A-37 threonylcarbamoyl transferase component Bud32
VLRRAPDPCRWETVPDFAPRLADVLASPARVIKESPAKLVARHTAANGEYYVKRYRHAAVALRPLKFFFKASQARQEWQLAQRLETLGVPIVRHVALGEWWTWRGLRESVLITEAFAGQPLTEAEGVNPLEVLAFVARLHDLGVWQRDLHPGNILASRVGGELRLVDLHGIRVRTSLTGAERAANLAFLGLHFPLPAGHEAARLTARLRSPYLARRAKRCLKHNRDFAPQRHGGLRWQVRLPFLNDAVHAVLAEPDDFLATRAEILKPGRSATVGRIEGLVLKRYNLRKALNVLKDCFRRSKARRAFKKAYHLELAGVPTARPVATADRRWLGWLLLRSYLLMEEIPGAQHLGQWRGDLRHAAHSAAVLLAKLHGEGFQHRDLKETNLVFDQFGRLFLIDLEGLEFVGTVPAHRAARDLARLVRAATALPRVRRSERVMFLRAYCKARGLRPRQLKATGGAVGI